MPHGHSLARRPLRHALVLGSTGFIGQALLRKLVAAGVRTTCLVHRQSLASAGTTVLRGSIDSFAWQCLDGDPPDVVFHLARIAARGRWRGLVARMRNRVANERLMGWIASCTRPPLIVYVGGTLAYGSHGEASVTEETPLTPISFSRGYHAAERPWLRALEWGDAPVIIARPSWVLGPGSWFDAYFRSVLRHERSVPLYGDGDNWMSIVHVDDCAELLVRAACNVPLLGAVNLFTAPSIRQREFVDLLARLTRLPIRRVSLAEAEARYGRSVREAFAFSARVASVHGEFYASYRPLHPDLGRAVASLL